MKRGPQVHDVRWPDVWSVHEQYAGFVWDALRRLGVGEADREDLRQDVFIIVHERLPTFRREEPLPPWLFGICRNVASVHRRRAYVRRETPCEQLPEIDAECDNRNPEEVARRREAERTLAAILDGLDLEKRAVLVMFEIHEMSLREIATALGVPAGTVSSRLHAARRAFGDALYRRERRRGERSDIFSSDVVVGDEIDDLRTNQRAGGSREPRTAQKAPVNGGQS